MEKDYLIRGNTYTHKKICESFNGVQAVDIPNYRSITNTEPTNFKIYEWGFCDGIVEISREIHKILKDVPDEYSSQIEEILKKYF